MNIGNWRIAFTITFKGIEIDFMPVKQKESCMKKPAMSERLLNEGDECRDEKRISR